jgi:urease accessory protein
MKKGERMKPVRCVALAATLAAYSNAVVAHPLHDGGASFLAGLAHPFLGVDHLLAMVAVGMWAACLARRAWWLVPSVFLLAMVGGGVLGLLGWSPPAVEPLVAASVLALGLLIASQLRPAPGAAAALVAFFAVFHGLAHAAEIPPGWSALGYAAGFSLSTAGLLLIGSVAGIRLAARPLPARLAGLPIALAGCVFVARALL